MKEVLTPARRYSFLVGAHEPNHTAQQQLVPLLPGDPPQSHASAVGGRLQHRTGDARVLRGVQGALPRSQGRARRDGHADPDHRRRSSTAPTSIPPTSPRSCWGSWSSSPSCRRRAGWASNRARPGAAALTTSCAACWTGATSPMTTSSTRCWSPSSTRRWPSSGPATRVPALGLSHPLPQRRPLRAGGRLRLARRRPSP